MLEMVSHELSAHGAKRFLHRRDLHHYVGAVTVAFDHSLETAHLALNSTKALQVSFFDISVDGNRF